MEPQDQTPQTDDQNPGQSIPVSVGVPTETPAPTSDPGVPVFETGDTDMPPPPPAPETQPMVTEPMEPAQQISEVTPVVSDSVQVTPAPPVEQDIPVAQAPSTSQTQTSSPAPQPMVSDTPAKPVQASDFKDTDKKKSKLKLIVIALLGIGILGGLVFGAIKLLGDSVKYSGLRTSTVEAGGEQDPSFSIQYPEQMKENVKTKNRLAYVHEDEGGKYSEINVSGEYVGERILGQVREGIKTQFKEGDGSLYNLFKTEIVRAAEVRNLQIGQFKDYSNPHVKDALIADVSFETKAKDSEKYVPAKGRFIFAFGKNHLYTATVEAIEPVWSDNEATFQSVLDNFRIDI